VAAQDPRRFSSTVESPLGALGTTATGPYGTLHRQTGSSHRSDRRLATLHCRTSPILPLRDLANKSHDTAPYFDLDQKHWRALEQSSRAGCEELPEDEQIDLVALMWLGRDDYSASDWPAVREEVARAHNKHTANYLLGTPLLGDFLEEGLSVLGRSCEEFEIGRL